MTDPLEDRLRSHFADRAARITVDPDPVVVVERSAGRTRIGAPLMAGVVAVAALLVGGSFATGMAVAGSSPASTPTTTVPGADVSPSASSASSGGIAARPGSAELAPLTSLFTRTGPSGVTIRAYTSTTTAVGGCTADAPCPPVGGVPPTAPCPKGAMCAQPVTTPAASGGPGADTTTTTAAGATAGDPGSGSGGSTGSGTGGTGTITTTTGPPQPAACQQLTLELSTAQAVWSASMAAPTSVTLGPKTVQLVDTGTFGDAEGAPAGFVTAVVSGDVASVRLVSSSGAVLDAMTPSAGVVVLAATGSTALTGTSVVGVDAGGATVATTAADQGTSPEAPGCVTGPTGPPVTPPTTVPTGSTTTTGPTVSTVVPPIGAATRQP